MTALINFAIQAEQVHNRAIRQAEILAQNNILDRETKKLSWFSKIITALTTQPAPNIGSRTYCHNHNMS